jgi:glucan phosphoethanolaminetransferase (alkaline phosphatase superfamily)
MNSEILLNKQKMNTEIKRAGSPGFTMIVLLVSLVLVVLLSLYAYSRTMKRVEKNMKEEVPEMNVPAPTIQNYQKTLDSVKENINQNVGKEQQRTNDAQKEMNK